MLRQFDKTCKGFQKPDENLKFKVVVVLVLLTEEAWGEVGTGGGVERGESL